VIVAAGAAVMAVGEVAETVVVAAVAECRPPVVAGVGEPVNTMKRKGLRNPPGALSFYSVAFMDLRRA
jgi:hypothetical protein